MRGQLHLNTGTGKGKTTAAVGLAVRAAGHGEKVMFAQFLKDGTSGEITMLKQLGVRICTIQPMERFLFQMTEQEKRQAIKQQTEQAHSLIPIIQAEKPFLTVLDELAEAVFLQIVPLDTAIELIDTALSYGDCVITGRDAPPQLQAKADYWTQMSAERHPYDTQSLPGRPGIEW